MYVLYDKNNEIVAVINFTHYGFSYVIKNSNNIILSSNLNRIHALVLLFLLGEDSLVNEKKKIVESIRHDCENELTEVSLAFSKTVLVDCVLINGFKA